MESTPQPPLILTMNLLGTTVAFEVDRQTGQIIRRVSSEPAAPNHLPLEQDASGTRPSLGLED